MPPRIDSVADTRTALDIAVHTAVRTESLAVELANGLHRQRQHNLFPNHMSEIDFIISVEADSKLFVDQTMFVFPTEGDVIGLGQLQEVQIFPHLRSKRL